MAKHLVRIGDQTYTADSRQPLINFLPSGKVVKGCLKGVCRVCRCRLVSGYILEDGKKVILQSEFLPCISQAEADSEIIPIISSFQPAKVRSITPLSEKVLEVVLEVKSVFYNAKSVVTLKHPESGTVRNYSVVAIGKKAYNNLCFHVKLRPGGLFSTLFTRLVPGDPLGFTIVNPQLPHYDALPDCLNVVSGGSGMGAALSRAQELIQKYNIRKTTIYAINRNEISHYHLICIETFRRSVACEITVINIPFNEWTSPDLDISSYLNQHFLTVGVGSDVVVNRLQSLLFCELESFG